MDDMINRHDSIAEENIEPNGRPAKNQFEEWSSEVTDRADNVFKDDTKDGPIKYAKVCLIPEQSLHRPVKTNYLIIIIHTSFILSFLTKKAKKTHTSKTI
jgi:hypothetical protein